jgi:hypothetical protein
MGHNVPNMLGVDQRGIAGRIGKLVDGYMAMGESGMAEMQEMQMPLPENTLPMMSGEGPFGGIEMGGMFTTLKVRPGLARNDYKDPGWYRHPEGSVAREWTGDAPVAATAPARAQAPVAGETTVHVRKTGSHKGH